MEGIGSWGLAMTVHDFLLSERQKKVTFQSLSPYFARLQHKDFLKRHQKIRFTPRSSREEKRPARSPSSLSRSHGTGAAQHKISFLDPQPGWGAFNQKNRPDRRRSRSDRNTRGKQTEDTMQRSSRGKRKHA